MQCVIYLSRSLLVQISLDALIFIKNMLTRWLVVLLDERQTSK